MSEVIVLGFHRSGTSMVAGILHNLGITMGRDMVSPDQHNMQGYYEDREFMRVNGEILSKADGSWERVPSLPSLRVAWMHDYESVKKLLHERRQRFDYWGWKDPQTCLTFPAWLRYMPSVRIVMVHRGRDAIVTSLSKREYNFDRYRADRLLRDYTQAMQEGFSILPPVRVYHLSYDRLVETKQIDGLCVFLGVRPTEKAREFIDPDLRHHYGN